MSDALPRDVALAQLEQESTSIITSEPSWLTVAAETLVQLFRGDVCGAWGRKFALLVVFVWSLEDGGRDISSIGRASHHWRKVAFWLGASPYISNLCSNISLMSVAYLLWFEDEREELPLGHRLPYSKLMAAIIVNFMFFGFYDVYVAASQSPVDREYLLQVVIFWPCNCVFTALTSFVFKQVVHAELIAKTFSTGSRADAQDLPVLDFCAGISGRYDACLLQMHKCCSSRAALAVSACLLVYIFAALHEVATTCLSFQLKTVELSDGHDYLDAFSLAFCNLIIPFALLRQVLAVSGQLIQRKRPSAVRETSFEDSSSLEDALDHVVARALRSREANQVTVASEMRGHMKERITKHPIAWYVRGVPVKEGKATTAAAACLFLPLLTTVSTWLTSVVPPREA